MAKKSKTRYALLGVLTLGPQSGYDIKQFIGESIGHFWQESYGQIYPQLKRLVTEGLATVKTLRQEGKPDRNEYTITKQGLDELQQWLKAPPELQPRRNELLLKLFFGGQVPAPDNIRHVEQTRGRVSNILEVLKLMEERLKQEQAGNTDLPYWLITLRSGTIYYEGLLRWCEETIAALRELEQRFERI